MSETPQFDQATLEQLIPVCLDFYKRAKSKERIDLYDTASKVGQAFGISDINSFAKNQIESLLQDGFGKAFSDEDSQALAAVFSGACVPVMNLIKEYSAGTGNPEALLEDLENLWAGNVENIETILQNNLGIPNELANPIADKFGLYAVSIYAFASAYKIYQKAARDAQLAQERRIEIERLANEAIAQLKAQREEMEQMLNTRLLERLQPFGTSVQAIDKAILENDDDGFISANADLQRVFGRTMQYSNASEFDELMLSDEAFKL